MINPKRASVGLLIVAMFTAFFIAFNGATANVKISMIAYAAMCSVLIVLILGAKGFRLNLIGDAVVPDVLLGAAVGGGFIFLNNLSSAFSLGAPAALISLEPVFLFSALVFVAPVVEEFIFRGLLYPFLIGSLGGRYLLAALFQAAVFAGFHFAVYGGFIGFEYSAGVFFGAFVFGTAMALLVSPRGKMSTTRLEAAIVAHAVFNGYLLAQQGVIA